MKSKKKKTSDTASSDMYGMDAKYRAESDVRTLVDADVIRKDKSRLSAAMSSAKEQMSVLKKVK